MSVLLDKSKTNQKAAELLKQKAMYSSVIHCLYYSCYQRMLHIWVDVWGNDRDAIRKLPKKPMEGSHEQFINGFKKWLLEKNYSREDLIAYNNILSLKSLRVKADYWPNIIDYQVCSKSQNHLREVMKTLDKIT